MILTVTLNPALDCFIAKRYSSVLDESLVAGGKGINVTRALNCLGSESCATGFLGGQIGRQVLKELNKEKLNHCFVRIQGETRKNTTIHTASGVQQRDIQMGPLITRSEMTQFVDVYKKLLTKSSGVVISGRNAYGQNDALYARLIRIAQNEFSLPVTLDSSGPAFIQGLKAKPWMIKPNLEEAQEALSRRIKSEKDIIIALKAFYRRGVEIVIISDYLKGAYGFAFDRMIHVQPRQVKAAHDVGCGDTLVAGFISAFQKTKDFQQSLCTAVAAAAANNMSTTPGLVSKAQVKEMLNHIDLRLL